jgi:hypothetical protein
MVYLLEAVFLHGLGRVSGSHGSRVCTRTDLLIVNNLLSLSLSLSLSVSLCLCLTGVVLTDLQSLVDFRVCTHLCVALSLHAMTRG